LLYRQDQSASSEEHAMPGLSRRPFALSTAVISSSAHENVPSEIQPPTEDAADAADAAQTDTQQQ